MERAVHFEIEESLGSQNGNGGLSTGRRRKVKVSRLRVRSCEGTPSCLSLFQRISPDCRLWQSKRHCCGFFQNELPEL